MNNTEETDDDATAFADTLLKDAREGRETIESLKELRDAEAYLWRLAGKDPECSAFHAACATVIYILNNETVL